MFLKVNLSRSPYLRTNSSNLKQVFVRTEHFDADRRPWVESGRGQPPGRRTGNEHKVSGDCYARAGPRAQAFDQAREWMWLILSRSCRR